MNKSKIAYCDNLEQVTLNNSDFRQVLFTGKCQLVLMSLKPRESIGLEVHEDNDQFFRFESGQGEVVIEEEVHLVSDGIAVVVPAGKNHNVTNTSDTEYLKFYTIYSPAHHPEGTIHHTKEEAMVAEQHE